MTTRIIRATFSAPSAAATYTANFTTQYLLTAQANPPGYGTVSGGGVYSDAGSNANVFASPNTGYAFQNWTGPVASSTSPNTTVAMTAPQSVTANFIALTPVTIRTSPTGLSFTVDSQTYNATYLFYWRPGETHTIAVATPQAGASGTQYVWNNWSDSGAISHTVSTPSTATTYTGFTAIDNGDAGTSDQFGLQVTGPSGTVPDLTFVPAALTKGNLQVPQKK